MQELFCICCISVFMKKILITGWLWYIGSHAVIAFEKAGYSPVILDNCSHTSETVISGIEKILWYFPPFFQGNMGDAALLERIFSEHSFDAVIHFAGLKSVGESTKHISLYHKNNISESIVLFEMMEKFGVRNIIFSSSATVYDGKNAPFFSEEDSLWTINPYGTTKLVLEKILEDYARHAGWAVMCLRYFNPIGAHPSGYIGEMPQWIPNNLLPYILEVAQWKREFLSIFWNDYDTPDGTGVRDYIDVNDLVEAHLSAYTHLQVGNTILNLGTGKWMSVLEMLRLTEEVIWKDIASKIVPRRNGDLPICCANPEKAQKLLSWKAHTSPKQSISTSWNFLQKNISSPLSPLWK